MPTTMSGRASSSRTCFWGAIPPTTAVTRAWNVEFTSSATWLRGGDTGGVTGSQESENSNGHDRRANVAPQPLAGCGILQ